MTQEEVTFSLSLSPAGGGQPTLPELLRLKVPQEVKANYTTFGVLLLNDTTGCRVDAIEDECHGRPERICLRILQEWLAGKGLPVDWQTLIKTLKDSELSTLADTVQGEDSIPLTDTPDTECCTRLSIKIKFGSRLPFG